ncbi:xylanase [Coprinopsis sp. MPI-PUGE-AT-0042]|nr:xylanase [Coprinopsis sp. MPI-PUGE-AT-0042]
MKPTSLIVLASTSFVGALVNPVLDPRAGTPNSSGIHNGFYYSWTSEPGSNATYTNGDAGTYSIQWSSLIGQLSGGKGWSPATRGRVISYKGTYQPNGNSILGVYGWTRNALVEYWISESYGVHNPAAGAKYVGTTTCSSNGESILYSIYQITRYNQPSIDGTQTFKQLWSVRSRLANRAGAPFNGTVDTECHFAAWKNFGMELGDEMVYQIFMTEGYYSSGKVSITVS